MLVGAGIAAALQSGFHGWEKFSLKQTFHYWYGVLAYAGVAFVSVPVSIVGISCCILAGLAHPTLSRTGLKNYTDYAEFAAGFLLFIPFVVTNFT